MRRSNLTDREIADIAERWRKGESQASIARSLGISQPTIWYWTTGQKISSRTVAENRKLKRRLNFLVSENKILKLQRKAGANLIYGLQPSKRRRSLMVPLIRSAHNLTQSQANAIVGLRNNAGHVSKKIDQDLIDMMWGYIARHPYAGFKSLCNVLRYEMPGSRHHALDVYREAIAKLELRAKQRPRRRSPIRHMPKHESVNRMWSVDFMRGVLRDQTEFWIFTGIDDFSREAIFAKAFKRRSAKAAVDTIDRLRKNGRVSACIRSDNGREFRSVLYTTYLRKLGIRRIHTRLYVAKDNSYVENLNKLLRYDVFQRHSFGSIVQAQKHIDEWLLHYNYARPQKPLGYLSPMQFRQIKQSV